MSVTHYLINEPTGLSAKEIEHQTGMRAIDTPLGVLLEKPKPFDLDRALADLDRAFNPSPSCTCRGAIIHQPGCPLWATVT